jgi:ABC-type branched-subunit amino acid transport system substrate-binding protein
MFRSAAFVFLLLISMQSGPSGRAHAQAATADPLFESGIAAFRSGDYDLAATAFGAASEVAGNNPLATASCVMAAKSEYRAGHFGIALTRANYLLDHYPASAYRADAGYIAALSEFRSSSYDIAASSASDLVREHPGSVFAERAAELFGIITSSHLPLSELKRLAGAGLPPSLHGTASLALARAYVRRGEDSLAIAVLDGLRAGPEAGASLPGIGELRAEIGAGETIQIAALLPLGSGGPEGLGMLGAELLDGIRYAEEEFNSGAAPGRRIDLIVQDVGMDSAGAASKIAALAASGKVRAVIGPVFSEPFSAASAAANASHLPIISPTASSDRLAAVGPFVFQANPDNETRGRAAARYAVDELRMSSFVIMASDDPVGRSHAAAFAEQARDLGATVYSTVFFPPGANDLRREFLAVRRAVMADGSLISREDLSRPGIPEFLRMSGADTLPAFRDTGLSTVSVTSIFGARGYAVAESLGLPLVAEDTTAGQLDVPMVTADGIYVALGDPEQLDYVAPQLDYFNIRAQVIGNNEWYDLERLRENRTSLDGAIFLSDFDDRRSDSAMTAFSSAFARRHGKPPTKFTLYGYDTMRLLLEQVRGGARTRLEIASRLAAVEEYPGLHSPITLRDGRVNRHLHVMKFEGGEIRRIGTASGGGSLTR